MHLIVVSLSYWTLVFSHFSLRSFSRTAHAYFAFLSSLANLYFWSLRIFSNFFLSVMNISDFSLNLAFSSNSSSICLRCFSILFSSSYFWFLSYLSYLPVMSFYLYCAFPRSFYSISFKVRTVLLDSISYTLVTSNVFESSIFFCFACCKNSIS